VKGKRVLVIDDEPDILELLDITLSRMGLDVSTASTLSAGRRALADQRFDLCLTDMRLPDGNGLDLVGEITRDYPHLPAAVITAHGRVEDAVQALKVGAFDFVSKPVDLADLRNLVNQALKLSSTAPQNSELPAAVSASKLDRLIGESDSIAQVRKMIMKLARSQAPVMISGASGSGKELAAQLIHELSPRADKPFVPVNCGAVPTELMESEFFGHTRGSFTGASEDKDGLFQAAHGGTLFLDEVADLPLHMQVKLLRAIQEKAVRPIGAQEESSVDVRILSATHKPLKPLIDAGEFRSDLYYRLNVIELNMPSLHDRPGDIPLLAEFFLERIKSMWDSGEDIQLSGEAVQALARHSFTGNVRELINILQRALTLCEGKEITADDLCLEAAAIDVQHAESGFHHGENLDEYLGDIEKQLIENALRETRFNKTEAAKKLGISFRQLRYKLNKYDID
jgi:two-component system response regulator PilR (NtrC family)